MAWAFARLRVKDPHLMSALASSAIARIAAFGQQEVSNMAWAFAKLEIANRPLMHAISAAAIAPLHEGQAQALSQMAWSYATLAFWDQPLLSAIASQANAKIEYFKQKELCSTAWAFARISFRDLPLSQALAAPALQKSVESAFTEQGISNLAWSLAALELSDAPFMHAISAEARNILGEFSSQGLANTAWAFAKLDWHDAPLMAAISAESLPRLPHFRLQELANLAWSISTLEVPDAPLLEAIASEALARLGGPAPELPRGTSAADASMIVVALLEAFHSSGTLSSSLRTACEGALDAWADLLDGRDAQRRAVGDERPDGGGLAADGEPAEGAGERPAVLAEQQHLLAVWKPPGWNATVGNADEEFEYGSAHRGAGTTPALREWVAQRLGPGHPVTKDVAASYGLAHRLDTYTSGVLLCAKTYRGFYFALDQFVTRRVRKEYLCLCHGWVDPSPRCLSMPLRVVRGADGSKKSVAGPGGRTAATDVKGVRHLSSSEGEEFSLVAVALRTGRMHQIRAHLAASGHALAGDAAYSGRERLWCQRVFLHACRLGIDVGQGPLDVRSPLPSDLRAALGTLARVGPEGARAASACSG